MAGWPAAQDPGPGPVQGQGCPQRGLLGLDQAGAGFVHGPVLRGRSAAASDAAARGRWRGDGPQFQPHAFAIEVNQFQQLLAAEFTRVAEAQQVLLPLVELDNQVNKQVRIRRLGTYLSQRQLRFKSRSAGTALLVQQLQDFPVGDHDDGPDALEQALRVLTDLWNGREEEPDSECTRLVPY